MKRRRHIVRWSVALVVLALLGAAGWLYVQARRVPENYRPARLNRRQRQRASEEFFSQVQTVHNDAQTRQPFTIELSEDRLNAYLAAMDEIAAQRPGGRPGQVRQGMGRLGLSDPAIRLDDHAMVLMVRSTRHNAVLSAEVGFDFTDDGKLLVDLEDVYVGRVAVPPAAVDRQLGRLRRLMSRALAPEQTDQPPAGPAVDRVAAAMAAVIAAMGDRPLPTRLNLFGREVDLVSLDIQPHRMILRFRPALRA